MSEQSVNHISDTGSKQINEDAVFIGDNLFAVFDGASPLLKDQSSTLELTGGQIASQTAKKVFSQDMDSLIKLFAMANKTVSQAQAGHITPGDSGTAWSTTISAVRLYQDYLECASVGDSPVILIDKNQKAKQIGGQENWDVDSLMLWQKLVDQGIKDPRHDLRMEAQILKVRRQANKKYGYCNGDPAMEKFIKISRHPLENIASIILMTDGFMLPAQDPSAPPDWQYFVELYQNGGLHNVLKTVRQIEEDDKNGRKYPRFKTHDDASAIAIDLI